MPHPITAASLPEVSPAGSAIGSVLIFLVLAAVAGAAIILARCTGRGRTARSRSPRR